ncbi:MAG TPA: spore germination protein, partial [Bacillota bacterium]|nr:spore germination protein [Bacillota bacterium]
GLVSPAAAAFCSTALLFSLVFPIEDLIYPTRTIMLVSIIMTAIFGVLGMVITASLVVAYLVSLKTADWQYLQTSLGLKRP